MKWIFLHISCKKSIFLFNLLIPLSLGSGDRAGGDRNLDRVNNGGGYGGVISAQPAVLNNSHLNPMGTPAREPSYERRKHLSGRVPIIDSLFTFAFLLLN